MPQDRLDLVVIAGDAPMEVLGQHARDGMRLHIAGLPASLHVLQAYFEEGRDPAATARRVTTGWPEFVSLNGAWLQQYLERHHLAVEVVQSFTADRERLDRLLATGPRAVAISTTFMPFAERIDEVAAEVRRLSPDSLIILGGIQVWKSYQHRRLVEKGRMDPAIIPAVSEHNYLMDESRPSPADALVVSEAGEQTLAAIVKCLRDGRDWRGLDNVAHFAPSTGEADGGGGKWKLNPVVTEPWVEVEVDWSRCRHRPDGAWIPIQAGVGCGFDCAFCDFRGLRKGRKRGIDGVVDEIRSLPPDRDGLRRIYFTDDNLFGTRERAIELCTKLIAADLHARWRGLIRVDLIDEELAHLLKASGCHEALFGIESGDPGILNAMHKHITPERILVGIRAMAIAGINTKSTFIIGFPGETAQSISNTVAMLNAYPTEFNAVHRYLFFTYAVLPLSIVAKPEARQQYGLKGYGFHWKHHTMTSAEAEAHVATLHPRIRPELSPNYVLESPDLPDIARLKRAYTLRNRLVLAERDPNLAHEIPGLWDSLEECFVADAVGAGR